MEDLSIICYLFVYLFNYLFILVKTHGYLFHILAYIPILAMIIFWLKVFQLWALEALSQLATVFIWHMVLSLLCI